MAALRGWDQRWSAGSVPTSLAVFWGEELWGQVPAEARAARDDQLRLHGHAHHRPSRSWGRWPPRRTGWKRTSGRWRTPWGEINRFQRLTGDIVQPFSDAGPSIPVPFTSAQWGSLASFGARALSGHASGTTAPAATASSRWWSSATACGRGRSPPAARAAIRESPHFNDQAERYATGNLREVYFYPSQLVGHTERVYRPGE